LKSFLFCFFSWESVKFGFFWGKKHFPNCFLYKKIEEKLCPIDYNLTKSKNEKKKNNSPLKKENKIKEKLLTCLIYPLLERTKIQTKKENSRLSFFSFLSVKRRLFVLVFFFPYSSFPHPLQLSVWPRMYHPTTEPHITAPRVRFGESRGLESGTLTTARALRSGRFGNRGERIRRKEIDRAVSLPGPIVGSEAAESE
jgi:hypothetical protein